MPISSDTIFALASGAGRAAVAVIRVSGRATREAVLALTGPLPAPRRATLRPIRDAAGEVLDRALVLWFPAPASFTGEDAAEVQVHGGRAVVAAVLRALAAVPGCRPAEAGEFTRRALLNDRLDLAEVEGLADLIDAQTEVQRRQAQRQIDGALGRWIEVLRQDLLSALALAEGAIDFADEDDLVATFEADVDRLVGGVVRSIEAELHRERRGARLRDGLAVVIAGLPNAGKSTLLNALAGREVAIVSAYAGTTRDVLTVDLELGGYPVQLIDTAGLRESDDPVEREGVARARVRASSADLVLWLHEAGRPAAPEVATTSPVWTVATKADLVGEGFGCDGSKTRSVTAPLPSPSGREAGDEGPGGEPVGRAAADTTLPDGRSPLTALHEGEERHRVSAVTGVGLDDLVSALACFAAEALVGSESAIVTRLRHQRALETARDCLVRIGQSGGPRDFEIVAEDLRGAATALDGLVGRIGTEEILGAIFARFCIGK